MKTLRSYSSASSASSASMAAAAAIMLFSSLGAQAQLVEMSGEYGESSGRIVNIPLNPPKVICGAGGVLTAPPVDFARCPGGELNFGGKNYAAPTSGVPVPGGHRIISGGLSTADTFTVPTMAFSQMRGVQSGPVIGNPVVHIDTNFTAAMPNAARSAAPPTLTHVMRPLGAVPISGQTGRLTGMGPMANTVTFTDATAMDSVTVTYTEGPNKFGGTMAALLDGTALLFIKSAVLDGFFPPTFQPVLGTQPVGNPLNTLLTNTRNGAGWNYTATGGQASGKIKGPADINTPCTPIGFPPTPASCNQVLLTGAITLDTGNFFPPATSTKHMFAWTTGTVSVARVGFRNGQTVTETLTAMGYDNTSMTGAVRNVGLVAGSYSKRVAGAGMAQTIELNPQVIGLDLQFTPEPAATTALLMGIGLLGMMVRRRS